MIRKVLVFVDGENLVMRYQAMIKDGRQPLPDTQHSRDVYVWNGRIFDRKSYMDIIRVHYYTSVSGDSDRVDSTRDQICKLSWSCSDPTSRLVADGHPIPHVYHKRKQEKKSHKVDINLTVDVMSSLALPTIEAIHILSGDGDYLPLINSVMQQGKEARVAAFTSGLHPDIARNVDGLSILDDMFFLPDSKTTIS